MSDADKDAGQALVDILRGEWLGHPVHPALTDVPIGAWTFAPALDGLAVVLTPRDGGMERAVQATTALGLAAAMPTMLTGMADLMTRTHAQTRREACLHGCLQCMAVATYAASLVVRLTGRRWIARGLALVGYALAAIGAWLGGHMVFDHGVGVAIEEVDGGAASSAASATRQTDAADR